MPQKRDYLGANMRRKAPFGEYPCLFPAAQYPRVPGRFGEQPCSQDHRKYEFQSAVISSIGTSSQHSPVTREFQNQNGSYKYTRIRVIM